MKFNDLLVNAFNNSLNRCQTNPQFLSLFYKKFVISNEEIREKFSNTNMADQKMILHASLYMIMLATRGNETASVYMDRVSKRHSKSELNIRPELYDIWLTTLLETVREVDPDFNEEVEEAWYKVMKYGINYMTSRYEDGISEIE